MKSVLNWLKRRIARSGNIVGTTDILARTFLTMEHKYPNEGRKRWYERVVDFRYEEIDLNSTKKLLIKSQISETLPFEEFVWAVLMAELDINHTTKDFQEMAFTEVRSTLSKYDGLR